MTWTVILSRQAAKDAKKLTQAGLRTRAEMLLRLPQQDPFYTPPGFVKLVGNLSGYYARRINIKYRLVYRVVLEKHVVHILRMWTHYE